MSELLPCTAYSPSVAVCANGFPQRPFCRGDTGCHACGTVARKSLPLCMGDEMPAHLITDSGLPALARWNTRAPNGADDSRSRKENERE